MLKKVSDDFIEILNYFNYSNFDKLVFDEFCDKIDLRVNSLVDIAENYNENIDRGLLEKLNRVTNEIINNNLSFDNIDYDNINKRLNN